MLFKAICSVLISSILVVWPFLAFGQITQIPQSVSGGAGGSGKYAATVSSSSTWTILGTTHGLGSADLGVFVSFDTGTSYVRMEAEDCSVNKTSYDVTCTFATAQAGRILLVGGAGGGGGGGDTTAVSNTGAGAAVLKTSTNVTARTLVAGTGIGITQNTDTITIENTVSGSDAWLITTVAGLDVASLSANTCEASERNTTVSGATAGWPAVVVVPWEANKSSVVSASGVVSSPNTVTWRVCNNSAGTVDLSTGNYTVYVIPPVN